MKKNNLLVILIIIFIGLSHQVKAQQDSTSFPLSIAITNNATQLPGGGALGLTDTPIHPGITIGTYKVLSTKPKHSWFTTFKFGYFYHHYSQHSLHFYSEIAYSLVMSPTFGFNINMGIGYLHAISDVQTFELSEAGVYEKKANLGRPQFTSGIQGGLYYLVPRDGKKPLTVFFDYRFWLQMPFVNEYVPMLPYSTVQLGILFHITK